MVECSYFSEKFKEILENFLSEKFKSERSRIEYARIVRMLCEYLHMDFLDLTYDNVEPFLQYQVNKVREGRITKETYNVRKSACTAVANYIVDNHPELDFENPFSEHMPYRVDSLTIPARRIPSLSDVDKLLLACKDNDKIFLIVSLALRMALTSTEIITLKISNIQVVDGVPYITLLDKYRGTVSRMLQIPEDIYPLLLAYIQTHPTEQYIFLTKTGNPYSIRSLDKAIHKCRQDAGVTCTLQELRTRTVLEMTKNAQANDVSLSVVGNYTGIGEQRLSAFANTEMDLSRSPVALSMIRIIGEESKEE